MRTELHTSDCATAAIAQVLTVAKRPAGRVDHRGGRGEHVGVDPRRLDPFHLPVDYVPFSQHLDYRPVGDDRPLGGDPCPG